MIRFEKCPVCGGEMVEKDVEKLLRGGKHVGNMASQIVRSHCHLGALHV